MNFHPMKPAVRIPGEGSSPPVRMVFPALLATGILLSCAATERDENVPEMAIPIRSELPADVAGGADRAGLRQAAEFAWAQFIALNWPAVEQDGSFPSRGVAETGAAEAGAPDRVRVWQTMRAKTEIFPGIGQPHGHSAGTGLDFGYDQPPLYRYDPTSVGAYPGLEPGSVPACNVEQEGNTPPWIELSESHEVGPEKLYAGVTPAEEGAGDPTWQRVLFGVKVDRSYYRYVAATGWLDGGNAGSTVPAAATEDYLAQHHASPPAGDPDLVAFPENSLQIKTAWRRLSKAERQSGRFITAWARSYQPQDTARNYRGQAGNAGFPCFLDSEWGLVGIHIKTRTPSAPYYIWATFEQADNLTTVMGEPVEDESGRMLRNVDAASTDPALTAVNAVAADPPTPDTIQRMSPARAQANPGRRLYYENLSGTPTTQGIVAVNRRDHLIPEPVIEVNRSAHRAISDYLAASASNSAFVDEVLLRYKLVGVQWRPADKPVPGENVKAGSNPGDDMLRYPAAYYLANMTLETSYRLQNFSGTVQGRLPPPNQALDVQDLVTDFDANGTPVKNVYFDGRIPDGRIPGYNMGGCMGCHGQIQLKGYDFSFIFRRGRINAPEVGEFIRLPLSQMVHTPAGEG